MKPERKRIKKEKYTKKDDQTHTSYMKKLNEIKTLLEKK